VSENDAERLKEELKSRYPEGGPKRLIDWEGRIYKPLPGESRWQPTGERDDFAAQALNAAMLEAAKVNLQPWPAAMTDTRSSLYYVPGCDPRPEEQQWLPARPIDVEQDNSAPRRTGLALAAGTLALVSALLIFLGSVLPFYTYTSANGEISPSLVTQGQNNSVNWYAAEPLTVVILVIAAGILLLTTWRPRALGSAAATWTVAGALLAFGIQTTMLFVGYGFLPLTPPAHHDAGGALGLFGGLVLIAAGIVALINNTRTQSS
jgi:hypothetical protein